MWEHFSSEGGINGFTFTCLLIINVGNRGCSEDLHSKKMIAGLVFETWWIGVGEGNGMR